MSYIRSVTVVLDGDYNPEQFPVRRCPVKSEQVEKPVVMPLNDLLDEALDTEDADRWERMATPVRAFVVRLHSAGLSLQETVAILDLLDIDRSHEAVWDWTHRLAENQADPP